MPFEQEKELTALKENLEKIKSLKYRAEAKIEQLQKRKEEILEEIKSLQVNPDNLEVEINKLEEQITTLLAEAKTYLPADILTKIKV